MPSPLPFAKYLFTKRNARPFYLIHFVTHACNASCAHCLQGDIHFSRKGDLSLDEIEKITESFPPLLFMFLTGGEPFIRDDFAEIAKLWYKNCGVQKFQIPSNGSKGDKAIRLTREAITACPNAHFGVSISLDAVGEDHDRSRNIPGLFEKACETFRKYQELEKQYSNFNCNITITFSKGNQDKAKEMFLYARDVLKAKNIFNSLVRGKPYDPASKEVDLDKFDELNELIDSSLIEGRFDGYNNFPLSKFVDAKNLISRKMISKIARERKYVSPCYAGRISCVLYAKGELFPCEMLDTGFGNFRDVGYDFEALWTSPQAEEIRRKIWDEKCFCTHECFVTHNILFNPAFIPRLLLNYAKLQVGPLLKGKNRLDAQAITAK